MSPKGVNFEPFTASSSPSTSPSRRGGEGLAGRGGAAEYSNQDRLALTSNVVSRTIWPNGTSSSTSPVSALYSSDARHLPHRPSGQVLTTAESVPSSGRRAHTVRFADNTTSYNEHLATYYPFIIDIHELLLFGKKGCRINFNLSLDPDYTLPTLLEDGRIVPVEHLDEPAVQPPVSELVLVKNRFPWVLRIKAPTSEGVVSVRDLLKGLFQHLRCEASESESHCVDWKAIKAAHKQRIADSPFNGEEKVRRVDFLCGKLHFCGLSEVDAKTRASDPALNKVDANTPVLRVHVG